MNTKKLTIICATLILAGVLFWPTLYRYDKMTVIGNSLPVRIHRLTGHTEYFLMGKWIPQEDQSGHKKNKILPRDERTKVTGNAKLYSTDFSGDVYNGSDWTITNMVIRVIAKEKDGSVRWDRKFNEDETISPLSTGHIYFSVTDARNVDSFNWSITEIRGFPSN